MTVPCHPERSEGSGEANSWGLDRAKSEGFARGDKGCGRTKSERIDQVQILRYAQEDTLGLGARVTSGESFFRPNIQGILPEIWLAGRTGANSGHNACSLCASGSGIVRRSGGGHFFNGFPNRSFYFVPGYQRVKYVGVRIIFGIFKIGKAFDYVEHFVLFEFLHE